MADFDAQPGRVAPARCAPSVEQLRADEAALHLGVTGVARIVVDAQDVPTLLAALAELALGVVPGADGAGVAVFDDGQPTWSATAGVAHDVDVLQYDRLGEGPGVTCVESGRSTVSSTIGSDARWPRLRGQVARMGVHSALGVPLRLGADVIGAISAYAVARDAFDEREVLLAERFATVAAAAVHNAQALAAARERGDRLQRALASRPVIDQAVGIIRSRSGGDASDAFGRLTQLSQTDNVKVADVAERLVDEAVRRARSRREANDGPSATLDP